MSSDEFYQLRSKTFSMEDVAVIRIVFKGQWYKSADYLAREKAALLGANGLILSESIGREDMGAGAIRTYRAFRLTNSSGRAVYTKPAEEAPPAKAPVVADVNPPAASTPAPASPVAPSEPRRTHRHFEWVWVSDSGVLSHRLGFNAARASKQELEQLRLYVMENFPAAQHKKLVKTSAGRAKLVLDFVKRTLE